MLNMRERLEMIDAQVTEDSIKREERVMKRIHKLQIKQTLSRYVTTINRNRQIEIDKLIEEAEIKIEKIECYNYADTRNLFFHAFNA